MIGILLFKLFTYRIEKTSLVDGIMDKVTTKSAW